MCLRLLFIVTVFWNLDHILNKRESGYDLRPQSFLGSFGGTARGFARLISMEEKNLVELTCLQFFHEQNQWLHVEN